MRPRGALCQGYGFVVAGGIAVKIAVTRLGYASAEAMGVCPGWKFLHSLGRSIFYGRPENPGGFAVLHARAAAVSSPKEFQRIEVVVWRMG